MLEYCYVAMYIFTYLLKFLEIEFSMKILFQGTLGIITTSTARALLMTLTIAI